MENDQDDNRTSFINLCGQCLVKLAITKIGYTSDSPYAEWIFMLTDKMPKVCNKCHYFICDQCRDDFETCPDPCNGNFIDYSMF